MPSNERAPEGSVPGVEPGRTRPALPGPRAASLLIAEIRGLPRLTPWQMTRFVERVLPLVALEIQTHRAFFADWWGDGFVAAFDDPLAAARCALGVRDRLDRHARMEAQPSGFQPTLFLDQATIVLDPDAPVPAEGAPARLTLAIRPRPSAIPRQVWATDAFIALFPEGEPELDWEDTDGSPQDQGGPRLYRLRRAGDPT